MGIEAQGEEPWICCDDQTVYRNLMHAGCGLGGMHCVIGDANPAVARASPFLALPDLPLWLAALQALRQTPCVRRVFDFLAAALRALPA